MFFAILAAALYAASTPISKILLQKLPAPFLAALLYLGAGIGISIVSMVEKKRTSSPAEKPLERSDLVWVVLMVVLDIAAPIFLMLGLQRTAAANASLLNNFEIVATSLIALLFFKEKISSRLWGAIALVTAASIILSVEDSSSFSFSSGSLLVLLASTCWGLENNCTRNLSSKDPMQTVIIKGFGSGTGSLVIAFVIGQTAWDGLYVAIALILGFIAYGLSIYFYIRAQRDLGAAKTSTFYAVSPFIGAALSFAILGEKVQWTYFLALAIMAAGAFLAALDSKN